MLNKFDIAIWGAGYRGIKALHRIGIENVTVFIDNDAKKQNQVIEGKRVIGFEEFRKEYPKEQVVFISPERGEKEIECQLQKYGFNWHISYGQLFDNASIMKEGSIDSVPIEKLYSKIQMMEFKINYMKYESDMTKDSLIKVATNFYRKNKKTYECPYELLDKAKKICFNFDESEYINIFIEGLKKKIVERNEVGIDLICFDNVMPRRDDAILIAKATEENIPILYMEDGFVESIVPWNNHETKEEFRKFHSFICDSTGLYLDARYPSDLENMLNSETELTAQEVARARNCISFMVDNCISKYNHQPVIEVSFPGNQTHVLIIDQVKGDTSLLYGGGNEYVLDMMISAAIEENPNADILVKKHPATMNSTLQNAVSRHENMQGKLMFVDYEVNPISLLKAVDKVYVCSSLMGFEALMCGKEVHTFGMPFYAGWGLTVDRQKCLRRKRTRTLEDIFYMAYILYSAYVDYEKNELCSLEECLKKVLELRAQYALYKG